MIWSDEWSFKKRAISHLNKFVSSIPKKFCAEPISSPPSSFVRFGSPFRFRIMTIRILPLLSSQGVISDGGWDIAKPFGQAERNEKTIRLETISFKKGNQTQQDVVWLFLLQLVLFLESWSNQLSNLVCLDVLRRDEWSRSQIQGRNFSCGENNCFLVDRISSNAQLEQPSNCTCIIA